MCGIFGFIGKKYDSSRDDLDSMKNTLIHRGPDSFDYYTAEVTGDLELNLGHVRLSIIDTTDAGNQPMKSRSGRYVIVFNGEIYNFLEIKSELVKIVPDIDWNGNSDTEVLLAAIEHHGLTNCLSRLVGMFAFSLWDNTLQKLYLVRDRIGEKPIYYGFQGDQLLFASELKAFEVHTRFEKVVNKKAAVGFLIRSCVPQELSIYENIYKIIPGTIMEFSLDDIKNRKIPKPIFYWSLVDKFKEKQLNPFKGTYEEAKIELEKILINSVKSQCIADVPLGAFLSGGIDSSLVCAIIKKHVKSDLRAFTIAMPKPGINELNHAKIVSDNLGIINVSKELDTNEILSRLEEILGFWDEPFADSSQIPTFFVSEMAKREVTVVLSGDGADEFVYGYSDHTIYIENTSSEKNKKLK